MPPDFFHQIAAFPGDPAVQPSGTFRFLALLILACLALQPLYAQTPDDFSHAVLPVLKTHCVPCHGGREAKGSFSLNTRELLISSGHVVAGRPADSRLIEVITSSDKEQQMPPADRPRLSEKEQQILTRWIETGVEWEPGFSFAPVAWEPPLKPRLPDLPPAFAGREHPVDRILDKSLADRGLSTPAPVTDAEFLRRVSLDLVGLLPTPEQLDQFLADSTPDKRSRLIRTLLDDRIAYADHWLTFFNDLLRNDYSGTGFITGGRQQISGWLYDALLQNKPFDQFARELIAPPTAASQGYIDGIRWRGEVSAGQTVEIQFAQSVAQSFLGINLKCASCHDSFIDRWTLDEAWGMAAIYASAPQSIHRCDKPTGRTAQAAWLFPELGRIDAAAPREKRLQQLAELMTHPENGRFTRTIVNRLWYRLTGRGIVHPLDAMQSPPWNADLLDYLASYLQQNNYDLKAVLQHIAESQAYQSAALPRESSQSDPADGWRGPVPRRLTAEQFMDAVWQLTASAPTNFDAPVIRAVPPVVAAAPQAAAAADAAADAAAPAPGPTTAQWIWASTAADGKVPAAGETMLLRKSFQLNSQPLRAVVMTTCDNGFTLFVNGRQAEQGDDWSQPKVTSLQGQLKKGENTLAVIATNGGAGPNAAGLFLECRIEMPDGTRITIASDAAWEYTDRVPAVREGRLAAGKGPWQPVTVVPALQVWSDAVNQQGLPRLIQAAAGDLRMVRASLMKNDFFMRSLGRPHREQIVSMRPDELTTLEAIDLSNGAVLATALARGAQHLRNQFAADRSELVRHLCRSAWSREPQPAEQAAILELLSPEPTPEEIADVLWAVLMTPEFLLVR
jgi:mono/diheme cytochrome c family protein